MRKAKIRAITQKESSQLMRWEKFIQDQGGVYPSHLAAIILRMTPAGVFSASERGHLAFFQIGRCRWYGRHDVTAYQRISHLRRTAHSAGRSFPRNFSEMD